MNELLKELYLNAISQHSGAIKEAMECYENLPSITKLAREFRETAINSIRQYCAWYATPDYEKELLNDDEMINQLCDALYNFALEENGQNYQ
jgi:hypothetical protein